MTRKTKLKLNTIIGFIYQIVAIICGFILPRLILSNYGSETNGLVNSINIKYCHFNGIGCWCCNSNILI